MSAGGSRCSKAEILLDLASRTGLIDEVVLIAGRGPHTHTDVGGHRLHLYCTGSGSPTVVLEAGGGASSSDFGWIAPAVARENPSLRV
jgi:hypothetical protein